MQEPLMPKKGNDAVKKIVLNGTQSVPKSSKAPPKSSEAPPKSSKRPANASGPPQGKAAGTIAARKPSVTASTGVGRTMSRSSTSSNAGTPAGAGAAAGEAQLTLEDRVAATQGLAADFEAKWEAFGDAVKLLGTVAAAAFSGKPTNSEAKNQLESLVDNLKRDSLVPVDREVPRPKLPVPKPLSPQKPADEFPPDPAKEKKHPKESKDAIGHDKWEQYFALKKPPGQQKSWLWKQELKQGASPSPDCVGFGKRCERMGLATTNPGISQDYDRLPKAGAGDWLSSNYEPGQKVTSFANTMTMQNKPVPGVRDILYVQPVGTIDLKDPAAAEKRAQELGVENLHLLQSDWFLEKLKSFLEAFFLGLEVKILPYKRIEVTTQKGWWGHQLHAGEAIKNPGPGEKGKVVTLSTIAMQQERNFALIGLTMEDLYTDTMGFVFGLALSTDKVGIFSLARHAEGQISGAASSGSSSVASKKKKKTIDDARMLKRAVKTMAHEFGHMFGHRHCIHFNCLMQGSNSGPEAEKKSIEFCPICLKKLFLAAEFDCVERWRKLANWIEDLEKENETENNDLAALPDSQTPSSAPSAGASLSATEKETEKTSEKGEAVEPVKAMTSSGRESGGDIENVFSEVFGEWKRWYERRANYVLQKEREQGR